LHSSFEELFKIIPTSTRTIFKDIVEAMSSTLDKPILIYYNYREYYTWRNQAIIDNKTDILSTIQYLKTQGLEVLDFMVTDSNKGFYLEQDTIEEKTILLPDDKVAVIAGHNEFSDYVLNVVEQTTHSYLPDVISTVLENHGRELEEPESWQPEFKLKLNFGDSVNAITNGGQK